MFSRYIKENGMNYARIISTIVLLGAINMDATGKKINNGTVVANLAQDGKTITISNVATKAVIKEIKYQGRCGEFTDIAFKPGNQMISATILAGTCPDHAQSTIKDYDIYKKESETSCFMQ